jgi:hypothetical protein
LTAFLALQATSKISKKILSRKGLELKLNAFLKIGTHLNFGANPMTHRTFDVHIRIKPNALIRSLYSGRTYTAINELGIDDLECMATMENENYVFRPEFKTVYAVSPDNVEIITD